MVRQMLRDSQWLRIADLLPGKPTDKGGRAADDRRFVEAVLYVVRTGCPWRDLPKELGNWHSVSIRFARWEQYSVWHRVAEALQGVPPLKSCLSMPPSSAPTSTRRARQKNGSDLAIGRSRGAV